MAKNTNGKDVRHNLQCTICENGFKEPKILPCFHTFCLVCLDKYVETKAKNNKFMCPLCRQPIDIPEGGTREFQNNFYIPNSIKTNKNCDLCSNPAVSFCTDCDEYYCSACLNVHISMKVSRDHRLVDLVCVGDKTETKFRKTTYCQYHKKEDIKLICKDCSEMVCVICHLTKHDRHRCAGLAVEADEKRQHLSTLIEQLRENKKQINSLLKQIKKIENTHKEFATKQKMELSKFADESVEAIREKERSLQHLLEERKKESLRNIKTTRKAIKAKNTASETVAASLESAFEKCSDADLLTIFEQVAGHVDLELDPNQETVYLLEDTKSFDIGWIGKITKKYILLDDDEPMESASSLSVPDFSENNDKEGNQSETTPNVSARQLNSASERMKLHDLVSTPGVSNEEIIDWIMDNVDEAVQKDGSFIREITNAVLCSAFEATGICRYYNGQIFANRKQLSRRFCAENPDLEYHLLCQVQLMITSLDMPPGPLLQEIYWTLWEQGIVSGEGFLHLESSGNLLIFSSIASDVLIQIISQIREDDEYE